MSFEYNILYVTQIFELSRFISMSGMRQKYTLFSPCILGFVRLVILFLTSYNNSSVSSQIYILIDSCWAAVFCWCICHLCLNADHCALPSPSNCWATIVSLFSSYDRFQSSVLQICCFSKDILESACQVAWSKATLLIRF